MNQLHVYFLLRNQQAFQRLLDGSGGARGQSSAGPSSGGGKSWSRPSPLSATPRVDVNYRDPLGRTVLHLAAASPDASATEYVQLLLAHPDINVNLIDKENHWTALHRALYSGNIATARLLLQRPDIDTSLRDLEGYTAFDLYNSTLEGTQPSSQAVRDDLSNMELFTWGVNRNAALGFGNGDDRIYPEQVILRPPDRSTMSEKESLDARFSRIGVREVAMSKLHTAVVTAENRGNMRICGFGSGGRLGPGQHTQYSLTTLPQFSQSVIAVALGQDHSLALTRTGEVYSWGLNRFSQLGYIVESTTAANGLGRREEPIQATARKVAGPLKNKLVKGVAACKTASACWTAEEVYTWGTNNGQLGYDKSAHPVQVLPRSVTKVSQPVISVSITDSALVCLLQSQEVVCLWNDGQYKVNFPAHAFPSEIAVYRPPHSTNYASIKKVTCCDNTFAALSSNGEVFIFTTPTVSDGSASSSNKTRTAIVPQRVWALRRKFSAVKDVALGSDGSIIICTESGHVFVRSRNPKAGQGSSVKTFKFQQIPYLQRVVKVCANATGAYAAIRVDYRPEPIRIEGHSLWQDLAEIQPYLRFSAMSPSDAVSLALDASPADSPLIESDNAEQDEKREDSAVQGDIKQMELFCKLLDEMKAAQKIEQSLYDEAALSYGADMMVHVQSQDFPAHRLILAVRCSALQQVLSGGQPLIDNSTNISVEMSPEQRTSEIARIEVFGVQAITVLLLLAYLYLDDVPAVWDNRVGSTVALQMAQLGIKPAEVKTELQSLGRLLNLQSLSGALDPPVKRIPEPSLRNDLRRLFKDSQIDGPHLTSTQRSASSPVAPDVVLHLADKDVRCHSVLLRARSPFFAGLFDNPVWTQNRWTADGTIVVDLSHLRWREMDYVVQFLCCGADEEMFDVLEDISSVDELLDFMFDVMAAATELLLDRMVLICSGIILKQIAIHNVSSVVSDASHFNADSLVAALHDYMAVNMETLLESHIIDDLAPHLVKHLSAFSRQCQEQKYPVSRSDLLAKQAMEMHSEWLALEDFPTPIVPMNRMGAFRDSPKVSPPAPSRKKSQIALTSPPSSPIIRLRLPSRTPQNLPADGEVFEMDDPIPSTPPKPMVLPPRKSPAGQSKAAGRWRTVSSAPRVDMRAIMAEAENMSPKRPVAPAAMSRNASTDPDNVLRGTPPKDIVGARASDSPWRLPVTNVNTTPNKAKASMFGISTPPREARGGKSSSPAQILQNPVIGVSSRQMPKPPKTLPKQAPALPGLGPVITPSKQLATSKGAPSSIRRVSSGSVWTPPPVQPVVQSSSGAMSFAAIQQAQLEQNTAPVKDKRSLLQIQEEERAKQDEEDFLRWWAAEEARLQVEAQASAKQSSRRPQKPQKSKKPQHSPSRDDAGGASGSAGQGQKDDQQSKPQGQHQGQGQGKKSRKATSRGNKDSTVASPPGRS